MNILIETPEQLLKSLVDSRKQSASATPSTKDLECLVSSYNLVTDLLMQLFPSLPPICTTKLLPLDAINANDYNPNKMGKPESRLLQHSIEQDGLTLPVLVNQVNGDEGYTLIDGFHRYELLKSKPHLQPLSGYIPALILNKTRSKAIATSVRHNIARGVHQVELTADMVIMLKQLNWSNNQIGLELGMDRDEVLRMQQITGLAQIFLGEDFSKSWE
ncbi:ParB/RepB/Spo0J family partition protein [Vibrio brasiliensis]|jgi:ParB-like chromosome segregation protein Spo0J|uniref:IbrB-like domain-containing protein n=1 Tax=Vibrio brasiliensis TaxID=170652 RepID=UPI001EFE3A20|nr:ParB/RepB/Spo0J family partition protein [Vibrio brasiliensis]MCG9753490.1 ParB/RepB/Spo0J family partition protein [Vibrio brasiliensis]MCG9782246.1 ParB/RepB/Spo0J family partition protein [Vibrio brasiliensis]